MICPDFLEFQDVLKKMRLLDDKIVYTLNTSIPTESFRGKVDAATSCKDIFSQLQEVHSEREKVIKNCIITTANTVKNLKTKKDENPNDFETSRDLKTEQRKLRLLQTELSVEEVIKEKTLKVFTEKCRLYYKPTED